MNIEEMNIDEAIDTLIRLSSNCTGQFKDSTILAFTLAISTLRAQQERENPKHLTLEELKERIGKVVWISEYVLNGSVQKLEINCVQIYQFRMIGLDEYLEFWCFGREVEYHLSYKNYGKTWVAYDYKPKGAVK